jgi:hypothetical protein
LDGLYHKNLMGEIVLIVAVVVVLVDYMMVLEQVVP